MTKSTAEPPIWMLTEAKRSTILDISLVADSTQVGEMPKTQPVVTNQSISYAKECGRWYAEAER